MLPSSLSGVRRLLDDRRALRARRITGSWIYALIRTVFLLGFAFIILYPVIIMISKAFMLQIDIYDNAVLWIPKHFTLSNIKYAIERMDYWRSLLVTTVVCGTVTAVQVFVCMMVGYGFARFEFPAKKLLFVLMLLTIMIPAQIIALPTYIKLKDFDILGLFRLLFGHGIPLLGSPAAFFLMAFFGMGIRSGLFILILRQCYTAMPGELEDAAAVDGCGSMRTYFRIMLPNAKNSLLTVFLFSVVWYWNDYYLSSIYLTDYPTVSTTLANLRGRLEMILSSEVVYDPYQIATMMQAGCLLTVGLLVIVYLFTQKWFTQGITASGIVG